jgi:hypothetical protein
VALRLAGCFASAGRHEEARTWLDVARSEGDARWWRWDRTLDLVGARVSLEASRGTPDFSAVAARARQIVDAGARVRCEDQEPRELPVQVHLARRSLERALGHRAATDPV